MSGLDPGLAPGHASADGPTLLAEVRGAPRAQGERLAEGMRAGEYEVGRFLGAGAMGEVYAGLHPVIGKRVAIKVLRRELAASPDAAERFLREARAVNRIDHPSVIDVFGVGRLDDGRLYLVMDLVEGRSLRELLAAGPRPVAETLALLTPIAAALDAAHARGVVHRDLKPDNVVVSDATPRQVFVLDFGIAKLVACADGDAAPRGPTLTGAGSWLGTPAYMAPEQWSADGAGPASDRYALGVIAFELLTGRPPFEASSVPQMMERHFRAPVPTLAEVATGGGRLPTALDPVLGRAMAKDPEERFPTSAALVAALAAAVETSAGAAATHATAASVGRPNRGPGWVPAALAVSVLGVGGLGVWSLRGGPGAGGAGGADGAGRRRGAAGAGGADKIAIDVLSDPPGAQLTRGGHLLGGAPATLELAADEVIDVEASKPGYLPARRRITATSGPTVRIALPPVTGFEGVWQLPSGELRAFERRGDAVTGFKLDSVEGPRQLLRRFEFVPVKGAATVEFAAEEEHVDERAPAEPTCHVPVRIEYEYEPSADALELRRERVQVDLLDGRCVVVARELGPGDRLPRVDRRRGEPVWAVAPAGTPRAPAPVSPTDPGPPPTPPPPARVGKAGPAPKPRRNVNAKPTPPADPFEGATANSGGNANPPDPTALTNAPTQILRPNPPPSPTQTQGPASLPPRDPPSTQGGPQQQGDPPVQAPQASPKKS
jgi:tRNA A-37 threonylcarbamoyl transferase component Bud32